jgi:hypothetical protein
MAFNDAYLFTFVTTLIALALSFLLPSRGRAAQASGGGAPAAIAG